MNKTAVLAIIVGALLALLAGALTVMAGSAGTAQAPGDIRRISIASDGSEAQGASLRPVMSANGRDIAFSSIAPNLVPDDNNGWTDVFVRNVLDGTTSRVSIAHNGDEAQGGASGAPAISAEGRFVAFFSFATNLVPNDTNGWPDIFVRDRGTQRTEIVSIASNGDQANLLSFNPSISAQGRFVAFDSAATNLVPNDNNNVNDVFVYDRLLDQIERVSITTAGDEAIDGNSSRPSISADGRYVVFQSEATNLVSPDANGSSDIFLHDRDLNITTLVSRRHDTGGVANGASTAARISGDGTTVVFRSLANNLIPADPLNGVADIFVYELNGETTMVSVSSDGDPGNGTSNNPSIGGDGRFVAYDSQATNLVPGKTSSFSDVFLHDRHNNTTRRLSVAPDGSDGQGESRFPFVARHGRYITFESDAPNLVAGDNNAVSDIFYLDFLLPQIFLPVVVAP